MVAEVKGHVESLREIIKIDVIELEQIGHFKWSNCCHGFYVLVCCVVGDGLDCNVAYCILTRYIQYDEQIDMKYKELFFWIGCWLVCLLSRLLLAIAVAGLMLHELASGSFFAEL